MRSLTIPLVQDSECSVSHCRPAARGLPVNRVNSRSIWSWVSRLALPGSLLWRKASRPSRWARLSHWLTAPGVTPRAAAISGWLQPASLNSRALRRRVSPQSWKWLGLTIRIWKLDQGVEGGTGQAAPPSLAKIGTRHS